MPKCKSCGAEISWALTKAGKRIPLDVEWRPGGNIVLDDEGSAVVVKDDTPGYTGMTRHHSHFSSCPFARQHRKPKE